MKFDLTGPCKDCPFRKDKATSFGWLGAPRAAQIAEVLNDNMFPCHKTVNHDCEDDEGEYSPDSQAKEQFCFGALTMINNEGLLFANRFPRMARMFGLMKDESIYKSDVIVDDRREFIAMHDDTRLNWAKSQLMRLSELKKKELIETYTGRLNNVIR